MSLAAAEAELLAMGVSGQDLERALDDWDPNGEGARAWELLKPRLSSKNTPARAARFLAAKGFDEDAVREALEKAFPDLDIP